jgi:IstB-like ATP binding protein
VAQALKKAHAARAFGSDYIANILRQEQVRRDVQPPLRLKDPELNELVTDPLSLAEYDASCSALERTPMPSLHQKLDRLNLTAMSHQLDQMLADAAAQNRSFTQTLESLADLELESRNGRAIGRRFRSSRLQARHAIDSFHFKHHKSRMELKNRILRLLDLEFLAKGTSAIFIGNTGVNMPGPQRACTISLPALIADKCPMVSGWRIIEEVSRRWLRSGSLNLWRPQAACNQHCRKRSIALSLCPVSMPSRVRHAP